MEETNSTEKEPATVGGSNEESNGAGLQDRINEIVGSDAEPGKATNKTAKKTLSKKEHKRALARAKYLRRKLREAEKKNISSNDNTDPGDDYKKAKEKYFNSLDPDAKNGAGADVDLNNGDLSEGDGGGADAVKGKLNSSLVWLTRFVLPILCAFSTRILSKGKKKIKSKHFHLDESEVAMLDELAEGAADEILGKLNPAVTYLLVVVALGISKSMDAWDEVEPATLTVSEDVVSVSDFEKMKADLMAQISVLKGEAEAA